MRKNNGLGKKQSRVTYNILEGVVREKIEGLIQDILDEEMSEFLGRGKSVRTVGSGSSCQRD